MKTSNLIRQIALLLVVIALSFAGCKKDDQTTTDDVDTKSLQQLSKDEMNVESASDDIFNDINSALSGNNGNNKLLPGGPCNVTVDSVSIVNDTLTLLFTFNGLNCPGNLYRKGQVMVKKHVYSLWAQAGTSVFVTFIDLKITKVATGKGILFNGTKTFVNVSGGLLINLGNTVSSVVHRVSGDLQATFDDNTTRTWYLARQKTFTGSQGNYMLSIDGFGSSGSYSNLVAWGVNRHGEDFYTSIPQTVVFSQLCGKDPMSGQKVHEIPVGSKKATLTFGYDANLQLVAPGSCASHYRLDWEKNGNSGTLYLALP